MNNGSGVSRGDRNRNARLARLRSAVPVTHAIVGIDQRDGVKTSVPSGGDEHHHSVDVVRIDPDDSRSAAVSREVAAGDPPAQGADAQPSALCG